MRRRCAAVQPGTAPADQDQSACHRDEGDPARLRVKAVDRDIAKSQIAEEHQHGDAQDVEPKYRSHARGNQQQRTGKDIFPPKIHEPRAAEGQYEAHALETRAHIRNFDGEPGCAEHPGGRVHGQIRQERDEHRAHHPKGEGGGRRP